MQREYSDLCRRPGSKTGRIVLRYRDGSCLDKRTTTRWLVAKQGFISCPTGCFLSIDVFVTINQITARSNNQCAEGSCRYSASPSESVFRLKMQNGQEGQLQQPPNGLLSRPTIRRKSSAGLLSSFKAQVPSGSAFSQTVSTGAQPQQQSSSSQLPSTPPISSTSSSMTSSSMTSISHDWDSASLHSESASSNTAYIQPIQSTSIEILRDIVQKRIVTLTYIRSTHEGFVLVLYMATSLIDVFSVNDIGFIPFFSHELNWIRHSVILPCGNSM